MSLRNCNRNLHQVCREKEQQDYGNKHGRTKPAIQTPTTIPGAQFSPRHGTLASTEIMHKTHQTEKKDTLSSLPGLHDTIPSGKDAGIPARSSDLRRGTSTEYNPC